MIFHARYIVYPLLHKSSNKNNLMVLEFYQKNIINQHFFSRKFRKFPSKNKYVCLKLETCMKKICKKNQIVTKSMFFAYKTILIVWKKIRYKSVSIQNTYKMRRGTLKSIY